MNGIIAILVSLRPLQETIEEARKSHLSASSSLDSLAGLEELMAIKEHLIPHTIFFGSND